MSEFLDRAKKHKEKHSDLRYVEIPELSDGDEPFRLYYRPLVTYGQKVEIFKTMRNDSEYEAILTTIIVRGLNEDGTRAIPTIERKELESALDADVAERVFNEMGGIGQERSPKKS